MSGSPFSNNLSSCDKSDETAPLLNTGVSDGALCDSCRKPGCSGCGASVAGLAPVVGVDAVRSMLTESTSSIGAPIGAGVGAAAQSDDAINRYIVTRRVGAVHSLSDASHGEMLVQFSPRQAEEAFGFSQGGDRVDITKTLVSNMSVSVENSADFGVLVSVPGFAEDVCSCVNESCTVKGAVFVGPRSSKTVSVLRDPEVISPERSPAFKAHTKESLAKYKHEVPSIGAVYHDAASPVFDRLMANSKLSPDRMQEIMSKRQLTDPKARVLHTIDTMMYDNVEQELLQESAQAHQSVQDLSQFQYVIRRADGKAFDATPEHIESIGNSVTRDMHSQQFKEMPSVVSVEIALEYASDV